MSLYLIESVCVKRKVMERQLEYCLPHKRSSELLPTRVLVLVLTLRCTISFIVDELEYESLFAHIRRFVNLCSVDEKRSDG